MFNAFLFGILIRSRQYKIIVGADIVKMFKRVRVRNVYG